MTARRMRGHWWVDFYWKNNDGVRERTRLRSPIDTRRGAQEHERKLLNQFEERSSTGVGEEVKGKGKPKAKRKARGCAAYLQEWFDTYVETNSKPSGQASKKSIIKQHLVPFFGKTRLDKIGVRDIERFKAAQVKKGLQAKTINNHLTCLRKAMVCAEEWGYIKSVPKVKWMKTPAPSFDFLTRDESVALIEAVPEQHRALILTALRAGLRCGELLGLQWGDVEYRTMKLIIRRARWKSFERTPKNGRQREVPMSAELQRALKAHRHLRGDYVFCQNDGKPLTRDMIKRVLPSACRRAGLRKVQFHALRHSFASQLVMENVPLKVVQELLGHATIEMTMRYAHLAPSMYVDAVALLDGPAQSGHYLGTGTNPMPK